MNNFLSNLSRFLDSSSNYIIPFFFGLILSLALTPLCRRAAIKLGMVDKPSARRINKTPIPRGGGLAVFAAVTIALLLSVELLDVRLTISLSTLYTLIALAGALCIVGLLDDYFGLPPAVKLAGQLAVAGAAWLFCGVSAANYFPGIPAWLDCALSVFWIVGAINAFNLIDGLDGLATGMASIASIGMIGALLCIGQPQPSFVYFIFLGACLGFLRYNFHPATVFLGDTGSMFLGYFLATTTLLLGTANTLAIGILVPMLAMGVPVFDTALAILRRTLRAALARTAPEGEGGGAAVMHADVDHIHHRVLRKFVSQRKAALALYAIAALLVLTALVGLALRDRAALVYAAGFATATYMIVRGMRRIELWDAARLMNAIAHDRDGFSRRLNPLNTPLLIGVDIAIAVGAWLAACLLLAIPVTPAAVRGSLALWIVPTFLSLAFFNTYRTIWGRAMISNFVRLTAAVLAGIAASICLITLLKLGNARIAVFAAVYGCVTILGTVAVRNLRPVMRDLYYAIASHNRLSSPDAERIAVYGAGLRYRMFRRELVRNAEARNRVIVGLIDDDRAIRHMFIGGIKVYGTLDEAAAIVEKLKIAKVVVTCKLDREKLQEIKKLFAGLGVKTTVWQCDEKEI